MKTLYVLGFMFDATLNNVVLIRKNRPEWQAGRLNGVGGKIEVFDSCILAAMIREFKEETGVATDASDWLRVGSLEFPDAVVQVYAAANSGAFLAARTVTDEAVSKEFVGVIRHLQGGVTVPHLSALIDLSINAINISTYEKEM